LAINIVVAIIVVVIVVVIIVIIVVFIVVVVVVVDGLVAPCPSLLIHLPLFVVVRLHLVSAVEKLKRKKMYIFLLFCHCRNSASDSGVSLGQTCAGAAGADVVVAGGREVRRVRVAGSRDLPAACSRRRYLRFPGLRSAGGGGKARGGIIGCVRVEVAVLLHEGEFVGAQVVQVVPRVDARVVQIVELDSTRVRNAGIPTISQHQDGRRQGRTVEVRVLTGWHSCPRAAR
jgi:hypothetical protein